jgi:hypothetical protein
MAIRQTKSDNLVETKLNENIIEDIKPQNDEPTIDFAGKKPKKRGFLASTVDELKKVEWPSLKYTVNYR